MTRPWRCACVIGSGMAGLMAARVLADHFSEVKVFERDPRPSGETSRAGATQGDHVHAFTQRGRLVIEALFPGLAEELVCEGAISTGDVGSALRAYMFGAWAVSCEVGFGSLQVTRPLLEYGLRRRVEALPNVSVRYGAEVSGLLTNRADTRVTGVRLADDVGGHGETVLADLIIDASGRGAVDALRIHGFSPPREDIVALDFSCVTAKFEVPPGFEADWSSLWVRADPPDSQLAFLQVVEGGRWLVSVGGRGAQRPEASEEGLREFLRGFPSTLMHDLVSRAKIVGPVKRYRFAASLHRRFDLLETHPENFLALGDAICSLNPVYGHGMSIAAMQVEALSACLTRRSGGPLDGLWADFYPRTLAAIEIPWAQCLALDMLYETTRFERPRGFALRRPMLLWAQKLSLRDPALRAALLRSAHLTPGPDDGVTFLTLAVAQARVWLKAARTGVAPDYRFTT